MAALVGIIGYPIRHSISPVFQQAALDHYSIDATYEAWEVEPPKLAEFIGWLRSNDAMGINVTVPHKETVIAHLEETDEWAKQAGAVNTLVNRGGKFTGHNTDGVGFIRALQERAGFSAEGANVLILGSGGSAKGVALALARQGASSITFANRTLERAQQLAELVGKQGLTVNAIPLFDDEEGLARVSVGSDLLVNCTTMGMKHGPDEVGSPIKAGGIPGEALVYDLVYNPPETPLLREAKLAGARTLGGLAMLVYQGAASFEHWTGRQAPVDVMMNAAERALV